MRLYAPCMQAMSGSGTGGIHRTELSRALPFYAYRACEVMYWMGRLPERKVDRSEAGPLETGALDS